jgi:hypothetical protein
MKLDCTDFFNVQKSDQYKLKDFTFENLEITAKNGEYDKAIIENQVMKNVKIK